MSLEQDIRSLVESVGLNLYSTETVSEHEETIFRVNIISPELIDGKKVGVTMEQCVNLTHLISPLLDVTPPVSGEYRLEVGSPGIERNLRTIRNFELSIGEKVSIYSVKKEKIRGILTEVKGSKLFIQTDDELVEIELKDVAKAKTYFEW
jgi:ribosome maturation factor RimP